MRILRNNPVARAIATLLLMAVFALIGVLPAAPARAAMMWGDAYTIDGIADHVDIKNVDIAKGGFKNTLQLGSQAFLAEPGKLLVGPEFPQDLIDKSGGATERINPLNQVVLNQLAPGFVRLPEGGFVLASMGYGDISVHYDAGDMQRDITVHALGHDLNNYLIIFRGLYGDEKSPSDRNTTLMVSKYEPGNNMFMTYPGRPNGGFISQGQFEQIAATSMKGGGNCGDAGCPTLTVIMVDVNTTAVTVIGKTGTGPWQALWNNWS